jgi:P27 family predicted phage terminase small subunit
MGNRPKPRARKILEGNPGKRRLPEGEPILPVEAPFRPEHLGVAAQEVWARKVREHIEAGVLSKLDGDVLAGYCEMYVLSARLSAVINDPAWAPLLIETVVDSDGGTQPRVKSNPAIKEKLAVLREMRLHAIEFGDTPASRSKVQAKQDERDPLEAELSRASVDVPGPLLAGNVH